MVRRYTQGREARAGRLSATDRGDQHHGRIPRHGRYRRPAGQDRAPQAPLGGRGKLNRHSPHVLRPVRQNVARLQPGTHVGSRIVTLGVDFGGNRGLKPSQLAWTGVVAAIVTDALEGAGDRAELQAVTSGHHYTGNAAGRTVLFVPIETASEPPDLARVAMLAGYSPSSASAAPGVRGGLPVDSIGAGRSCAGPSA